MSPRREPRLTGLTDCPLQASSQPCPAAVTWAPVNPDTLKGSGDHRPAQTVSLELMGDWRGEGVIYKQVKYFRAETK